MLKKIALITIITVAQLSAYDKEIAPKCEWLYDLSQSRLAMISKLTDFADANIGVEAKDAYSLAEDVIEEFNIIVDSFKNCQSGKHYLLTSSDLTTEDEVAILTGATNEK